MRGRAAPSGRAAWTRPLQTGLLACLAALALVLSICALVVANRNRTDLAALHVHQQGSQGGQEDAPSFMSVRRIAFGSCTSHDLRPQPIWAQVAQATPDAWIWVGDMTYADAPFVDCK